MLPVFAKKVIWNQRLGMVEITAISQEHLPKKGENRLNNFFVLHVFRSIGLGWSLFWATQRTN